MRPSTGTPWISWPQFSPIVVEKPDGEHMDRRVVHQLPQDVLPGVSRSDQQHPLGLPVLFPEYGKKGRLPPGKIKADSQPYPGNEDQRQQEIQDEDGAGKSLKAEPEQDDKNHAYGRGCHRLDDIHEIHKARISPHAAVEIEKKKASNLYRNDYEDCMLQRGLKTVPVSAPRSAENTQE